MVPARVTPGSSVPVRLTPVFSVGIGVIEAHGEVRQERGGWQSHNAPHSAGRSDMRIVPVPVWGGRMCFTLP